MLQDRFMCRTQIEGLIFQVAFQCIRPDFDVLCLAMTIELERLYVGTVHRQ